MGGRPNILKHDREKKITEQVLPTNPNCGGDVDTLKH